MKNNLYKLTYNYTTKDGYTYPDSITYILGDSVKFVVNKFEESKNEDFKLIKVEKLGICFYYETSKSEI